MSDIIRSTIRERGVYYSDAACILFILADADETYDEYMEIVGQGPTEAWDENIIETMGIN